MEISENDLLLVTGATGLVGSHVAQRAREMGIRTRALVRPSADSTELQEWGVEIVPGDMTDPQSLKTAAEGATIVVHCAAKVGDWGPVEDYRTVNVQGVELLLKELEAGSTLKRLVHISSLGVYQARDHHGTDETEAPNTSGIDGYTLTKVESENVVRKHIKDKNLPAIVLRPGFVYGPRDRTVLPRIFERLRTKGFKFLGSGEQLLNNVFVGNLVDAVFLAIKHDEAVGDVFNITDGRLVSKREFITKIAEEGGFEVPTKCVPLPIAKALAKAMESTWKLLGKKEAPLLSNARIKFLGLNLDFCIDKARRELEYAPAIDFQDGMKQTMDWYRAQGLL